MSILRRKMMGYKLSSRGGVASAAVKMEIVCTASPSVDTALDVAAYLKLQGFSDGAPLLIDPRYTCTDIDLSADRATEKPGANGGLGLWYWPVDVVFSTQPGQDPSNNSQKDDPTKRLPEISITPEIYTLPATFDANGDSITNSAGDPIRLDDQRSRRVVRISRILDKIDGDAGEDCRPKRPGGPVGPGFAWSRNQNTWNPFGRYGYLFNDYQVDGGKGLLRPFPLKIHWENNRPYVSFDCEVLVDEDFHRDRPWDVGFRGWVDEDDEELGNPTQQLIDERNGMFPAAPLPLDGTGRVLRLHRTSNLVALNFQRFPEKDWSKFPALNIP